MSYSNAGPPFPDAVLTSPRLTLRAFEPADIEDVQLACADPLTQMWLPLPNPYTREHAATFALESAPAARQGGTGLVRAIDVDGRLAGAIDLKRADWTACVVEIGYWSVPGARGQGHMTEATKVLARWVLEEMGFVRVELRIAPGNVASLRVAEKAGFAREGIARSAGFVHSGRVDLVIYSLISADLHHDPRQD